MMVGFIDHMKMCKHLLRRLRGGLCPPRRLNYRSASFFFVWESNFIFGTELIIIGEGPVDRTPIRHLLPSFIVDVLVKVEEWELVALSLLFPSRRR